MLSEHSAMWRTDYSAMCCVSGTQARCKSVAPYDPPASGHAMTALLASVMNSRRLMCSPQPRVSPYHIVLGEGALCITANLGGRCLRWVKSGNARCEHLTSEMPSIADIVRTCPKVRVVPIADIRIAPNYFRAYYGPSSRYIKFNEPHNAGRGALLRRSSTVRACHEL
jgi:hypothetical protein